VCGSLPDKIAKIIMRYTRVIILNTTDTFERFNANPTLIFLKKRQGKKLKF
jgi:hypothetical protein